MVADNYIERFAKKSNLKQIHVDWIGRSMNKISFKKAVINGQGEMKLDEPFYEGVHIFREKEGPDDAILYTYRKDGLDVGDLIVKQTFRKDSSEIVDSRECFLLFEEAPRVDGSQEIRVFSTIEANVIAHEKGGSYFAAYFKGDMRNESQLDYSLKVNFAAPDMTALMIVPIKQRLVLNSDVYVDIKSVRSSKTTPGFSWRVEDKDELTTADVQYVSIKKILRDPEIEEEPIDPTEPLLPTLAAGVVHEVPTYGAHFAASRYVKITKRQARLITFEVPSTAGELEITTMNELGEEVKITYLVVI